MKRFEDPGTLSAVAQRGSMPTPVRRCTSWRLLAPNPWETTDVTMISFVATTRLTGSGHHVATDPTTIGLSPKFRTRCLCGLKLAASEL